VRDVPAITAHAGGVRLRLRIQPRASTDEVVGLAGDAIRLRLSAPPVDGAANDALTRFLALRLQVPRAAVELVSGRTGRTKLVSVAGITREQAARRLGVELG
jgi:uncharacterized protein (TIGR00251 family)